MSLIANAGRLLRGGLRELRDRPPGQVPGLDALLFWVPCDRSILTKSLNAWIFYPISRLSYGMYLNHWWALPITNGWLVLLFRKVSPDPTFVFLASLAGGIGVSVVFAAVTFVFVEHPFLVLRDRVMASTRKSAPAGAEGAPPVASLAAPQAVDR